MRIALTTILLATLLTSSAVHAAEKGPLTLHPKATVLPTDAMGPFVRLKDSRILAVEDQLVRASSDEGATWETWPLALGMDFEVSRERALLLTREGTTTALNAPAIRGRGSGVWPQRTRSAPFTLSFDASIRHESAGRDRSYGSGRDSGEQRSADFLRFARSAAACFCTEGGAWRRLPGDISSQNASSVTPMTGSCV